MASRDVNISDNEYNDQYNIRDNFSMVLFRPNAIVSQRDLNEEQSELQAQISLMGNYEFQDGTIISGMHLTELANNASTANTESTNNSLSNLLPLSNVSAENSTINTDDWFTSGIVSVIGESEQPQDYPGIEMDLQNIPYSQSKPNYITVSFGIKKTEGNLHNIGFSWADTATQTQFAIDGTDVDNNTAKPLDSKGNPASLNDGQFHTVTATFQITDPHTPLYLVANNGFDMTSSDNTVDFELSSLMVNTGTVAQSWVPSNNNHVLPQQGNRDVTMNVSSGYVYVDGMVRRFNAQNINIVGHGKETIGINVDKRIVTAGMDHDLYDTTKGAISQGERLADRLQYNVQLAYNDPNATPLFHLVDGKVINGNGSTGNARLDAILAARTYDQSGSFRVSGFDFWTTEDEQNKEFYTDLHIDAGIAYVMGYAVYKLAPTTIPLHISDAKGDRTDEDLHFSPKSISLNEDNVPSTMTSDPLSTQPVQSSSINVFGPVVVSGAYDGPSVAVNNAGEAMIPNAMEREFGNAGPNGLDRLPDIFQAIGNSAGGALGNIYVHFGTASSEDLSDTNLPYDQYVKDFYRYIIKYDAYNQVTTIYKNVNYLNKSSFLNWDIHTDDDSKDIITLVNPNDKSGASNNDPSQGLSISTFQGEWFLNWGPLAAEALEDCFSELGTGSAGSTYFVDGIASYEYKGPYSDNLTDGEPDYNIVSNSNPETMQQAMKGIQVKTPGSALQGAAIQFGGSNTTGLMPPDPYISHLDYPTVVNYKYYDATVDILTLDKNGHFGLVKGTPAPMGEAKPYEQISPDVLKLGYIVLTPDSWKTNCQFSSVTRIPFSGLQDLVTRVSNLETTVQNSMLNSQAKSNINPSDIQNTLNDDFTTLTTADVTFADPYSAIYEKGQYIPTDKHGEKDDLDTIYYGFNVAYDLAHGIISLNDYPNSVKPIRPQLDRNNPSYQLSDHIVTAPYLAEYPQESQIQATGVTPINGLSKNSTSNGLLDLFPNADDFVNCANYEFQSGRLLNDIQLHNWFSYNNGLFEQSDPYTHLDNRYSFGNNFNVRGLNRWSMMKETGLETALTGTEYVQPRKIKFQTQWLVPNSTGYYILINDQIPVSANFDDSSDYSKEGKPTVVNGTKVNTINADRTGTAEGTFNLPDNLTTGIEKISLVNSTNIGEPSNSEVSGTYYANGIENDDVGTVTHDYEAQDQYEDVSNPPIAQIVHITKDSILTKLDLFFASSPNAESDPYNNVLVQLRKVDPNGYPSNIIMAQSTVSADSINNNGKGTMIRFNDPVYVHQGDDIAITLVTNSSNYSLFTASTNKNGEPYPQGTMYQSNGSDWEKLPNNTSMQFILYRASFAKSAKIKFKPCENIQEVISKVSLLADYITPDNSSLGWSVLVSYGSSKNGTSAPILIPLNRRRRITKITDGLTSSSNNSIGASGQINYNQISSIQLICTTKGSPNPTADDEINSDATRISPMINADTVALAISESVNNTNLQGNGHHLNLIDNPSDGNQTPIYKAMTTADGMYITRNIHSFGSGFNTVTTTFDAHVDDHTRIIPIYTFTEGRKWGKNNPGWNYYYDTENSLYKDYPKVLPVNSEWNQYTFKVQIPNTGNGNDNSNYPHNFKMGLLLYSDSPYHQPMVKRLTNALTIEDGSEEDNRPFAGDNDTANYIDWKNDSNNPSDPFDWSGIVSNDYNSNYNSTN